MRSRRAALLLVVAASCGHCSGGGSASSAEELLPAQVSGAVVTAPLATLAQHFAALVERAAALPGGEQLGEARRQIAGQLGFDPLSREGQLAAGLDPDRGAAVALTAPPSWIAALPLSKPELFLSTFDRLTRERAGYAVRSDEARGDLRIAVYAREPQSSVKLAVAVVRGYGVVARGADPAGEIAAAATRKDGLAQDPRLKNARARLQQDVLVLAPAGTLLPKRFGATPLPGEVTLGLSGTAQGLSARVFAQLPQAPEVAAALPGGGASLVQLLPPDAPLKVRLGLSPSELRKHLGELSSRLEGVDAELLAALQPGAVLSLQPLKSINVAAAMDYGLDFSRKSPFDSVQLVALARTADRARALAALGKLAAKLPSLGARVERNGDDFKVTYGPSLEGARFGIRADGLAYLLGGALTPEQLVPQPAGQGALWTDAGAALELDLGKLAAAVDALPEGAYGSGPQAYVARSLVSQVVQPLRPLRLRASAAPDKDGLSAAFELEIVAP